MWKKLAKNHCAAAAKKRMELQWIDHMLRRSDDSVAKHVLQWTLKDGR